MSNIIPFCKYVRPDDIKTELDDFDPEDWTLEEVVEEFAAQNAVEKYVLIWTDTQGSTYFTTHETGDISIKRETAACMLEDLLDDIDRGEDE